MSRILIAAAALATLIAGAPARADDFPVNVEIVTANTTGAGTDAVPISLTISYINAAGEENGYLLQIDEDRDPQTGANRFEQGSTDVFRVDLPSEVDHFTQIELSTNIASMDHVSQTFTMAPWTVASVTITPLRNSRLPDGEILAIQPTVFTINAQIDANLPTLIAYPDGSGAAPVEPEVGAEPVDQPELQPEPTTDSPGAASAADANNARCKALVQGHVAWDKNPRNTSWNPENLDRLCSSGQDADAVVACFQRQLIANNYQWKPAVDICAANAAAGDTASVPGNDTPPNGPTPPPSPPQADDLTERCKVAVQDKVLWDLNHPNDPAYRHWQDSNLNRLCQSRAEPRDTIACFNEMLAGNGNQWSPAIDTCSRLHANGG